MLLSQLMETIIYIFIYLIVFAAGAVIGSFLNELIYRLPRGESLIASSFHCSNCQHKLNLLDLVPIFSYLFLGRKCRYCQRPISVRYLLIELAGGALAVLSFCAFMPPVAFLIDGGEGTLFSANNAMAIGLVADWLPFEVSIFNAAVGSAALVFAVLCFLLLVTIIDADTMEIPNSLSIWLAGLGLVSMIIGPTAGLQWYEHIIGVFCVSLPMLIVTIIIDGAFGLGDVKLMAAVGLILGWQLTLLAAFIGILIGGFYGVFLLITSKKGRKEHFAFGPALCAGIAISIFLGKVLFEWYLGFMG